jgi:hypothetical protein
MHAGISPVQAANTPASALLHSVELLAGNSCSLPPDRAAEPHASMQVAQVTSIIGGLQISSARRAVHDPGLEALKLRALGQLTTLSDDLAQVKRAKCVQV